MHVLCQVDVYCLPAAALLITAAHVSLRKSANSATHLLPHH
jgi:hypothetical protein